MTDLLEVGVPGAQLGDLPGDHRGLSMVPSLGRDRELIHEAREVAFGAGRFAADGVAVVGAVHGAQTTCVAWPLNVRGGQDAA